MKGLYLSLLVLEYEDCVKYAQDEYSMGNKLGALYWAFEANKIKNKFFNALWSE